MKEGRKGAPSQKNNEDQGPFCPGYFPQTLFQGFSMFLITLLLLIKTNSRRLVIQA
jgi:hypothetical protein